MELFPPFEPHATGALPVGDGHELYWEVSGNPDGPVVVFIHGGPGASTAPTYRRFFDPSFWRIALFDQRGCGRSRPHASVEANTTAHLVADLEVLRHHLGVERWLLFGGSWGSTLALAYGQAHPGRCTGFVMRGIFLFRPDEVEWFMSGMGRFFPEAHRRFMAHLPEAERVRPLAAYLERLTHPDTHVHMPAARVWCGYEEACARLLPRDEGGDPDGPSTLALARIEAHYMAHQGFMRPNQLLDEMDRIRHLPAIIVQGRYDLVCPPQSAADLARAWPGCELRMVPDAGHSAMEPGIRAGLVDAVERMKMRIRR
ncbi:prolyl aminopeptidase [Paramagnetospirillum magneticum]|uniref:Proline iminopeptidase n=1 Tax=Paramagnetospirillum magneticum (strain ATCC 700264 / AMB-1) TaxID=342108 RepID=Q2W9S4_PARM1|nr:prolyl aminopeptidase [Paramagnetospirillum magneticum]BAE49401.1 Predicted hydrolase or acyltransferase [Paramagnetospirillum magneticum AMB-1]